MFIEKQICRVISFLFYLLRVDKIATFDAVKAVDQVKTVLFPCREYHINRGVQGS